MQYYECVGCGNHNEPQEGVHARKMINDMQVEFYIEKWVKNQKIP